MTDARLTDADIDLALARAQQFVADHAVDAPRFEPSYFVVARALLQVSGDLASAKAELAEANKRNLELRGIEAPEWRKVDVFTQLAAVERERDQANDKLRAVRAVLHRVHEIGNAAGWAVLSDERGMISGLIEEALGMGKP